MTEQEYNKQLEDIFNRFPSFQKVGGRAYKPGIEGIKNIDAILDYPSKNYKVIHIAGTNGKGSTSHMLASVAMGLGYKVGLFTSPHLLDFRERIKVNGELVKKEFVYNFISKYKEIFNKENLSFFEITTAMAFAYFAQQKVDIAVIECGLGGRLDSTNIVKPCLSIITNIGKDHCEYLGNTLEEIALEKAGIIKAGVPIIIGEKGSVKDVFIKKANELNAPIYFAEDIFSANYPFKDFTLSILNMLEIKNMDLQGDCQLKNVKSVSLAAAYCFSNFLSSNFSTSLSTIVNSIEHAAKNTGLRGRWERLYLKKGQLSLNKEIDNCPTIICDTGHNVHGFTLLREQILRQAQQNSSQIYLVFGVVADKDIESLSLILPNYYSVKGVEMQAHYIFVNARGVRSLSAKKLGDYLISKSYDGTVVEDCSGQGTSVIDGCKLALKLAKKSDFIFIGGSTFVVAEALECGLFN